MPNSTKSYRGSLNVPRRFISSAFTRHSRLSVQPHLDLSHHIRTDLATSTELDVRDVLNEPVPEAPDSSYFSSTTAFPSFPTQPDVDVEEDWELKPTSSKSKSESFARFRSRAGYNDSDTEDEFGLPSEKTIELDSLQTATCFDDDDDEEESAIFTNFAPRTFTTPERPAPRHNSSLRHSVAADLHSQGWDAETLSRTPAKCDNDKWLESLGFDMSLLKINSPEKDEIENQDPNSSKYTTESPKLHSKRRPMSTAIESPISTRARPSLAPLQSPSHGRARARTARRTLDITVGSELSRQALVSAGDVKTGSARKSKRASARVSRREMKAILEGQSRREGCGSDRARAPTTGAASCLGASRALRKLDLDAGQCLQDDGGSEVVLTPVRASKQQRRTLGSDRVVTPVRRSLRHSYRKSGAADLPPETRQGPIESADYAYVPNQNLTGAR